MKHSEHGVRARRLRAWFAFAVAAVAALQAPPADAVSGIRATVTYKGTLGPVGAARPLCLCVYTDELLSNLLGCAVSRTNGVAFRVDTGDTADYYLIAFLDLDLDEERGPGEPFEIYRDRAAPPADAVAAQEGFDDIAISFGDENLPSAPTPTATATTVPTATPTLRGGDCGADCDGSGHISVADIETLVDVALGSPAASCSDADLDHSGSIEIDELVTAVAQSRGPCS